MHSIIHKVNMLTKEPSKKVVGISLVLRFPISLVSRFPISLISIKLTCVGPGD